MWKIVQFVNELTQNPMNRVIFFWQNQLICDVCRKRQQWISIYESKFCLNKSVCDTLTMLFLYHNFVKTMFSIKMDLCMWFGLIKDLKNLDFWKLDFYNKFFITFSLKEYLGFTSK